MKTSEILFRAAQIIERDGHCKMTMQNSRGSVCLMGAISKAFNGDAWEWNDAAAQVCEEFCDATGFKGIYDAVDWNNAPERTKEEVIDALVIASIEAT